MKHISIALLSLLVACGSSDRVAGGGGGGGGGGGDVDAPPPIDYHSFAPHTRSLGLAADHFQLSLTDTIGPIACGLATDFHNGLGTSGSQILIEMGYAAGYPCPTGTHTIKSNCDAPFDGVPYVPENCAYYRAFDNQARDLGTRAATAGAVTVTGNDAACTFTINLSFAGQAFTDTFTLTNGLSASPWCKQ